MQNSIFSGKNFKLFGLSIALLVVGYILLGQGPVKNPLSMSVAPVILVVTYCVVIPIAILFKGKEDKNQTQQK